MFTLDVRFEAHEWIAAWRPVAGRLKVKTPMAPRLHAKLAVRIHLVNPSVRATVVGTVVSSHYQNAYHDVELAVEAESLDAAGMLLAAAKGEPVSFRERPPRYTVQLPVLTSVGGAKIYLTTSSVSLNGCSLRWPGSLPRLGETVSLRFSGSRSVDMRGVVRWTKPARSMVGVRFVDATADAWQAFLEGVRRSGVLPI